MVREHHVGDIERIIEIYTQTYKAMPEEIETLRNSKSILVYEENEVLGFAHYIFNGTDCYLEIGVDAKCNIVKIGSCLWEKLGIKMAESNIKNITTFHIQEDERWKQLFDLLEFNYKYSVHRLMHNTEVNSSIDLTIHEYSDEYFDEKIRLESEAFEPVRKANNITPYNWYEGASEKALSRLKEITRNNSEYIKIYKNEYGIVGVSQVKDREIELIFTVKALQGKGYGNQILKDAIARGKKQGDGNVFLNVISQNEKALKLYYLNHFKKVQSQDCRCKVLDNSTEE